MVTVSTVATRNAWDQNRHFVSYVRIMSLAAYTGRIKKNEISVLSHNNIFVLAVLKAHSVDK